MSPDVHLDDDVFEYLKQNAEPFVDTPSSVLRRELGINGATPHKHQSGSGSATARAASRRKASAPSGRAAPGSLLPEPEYEMPILRYLDENGGRAPSREVVEGVGVALKDKLTPEDHELLRSGDVRWKSRAAFVRLRLVERGDLDREAPRGTWAITDQGRDRVQNGS